MNKVIFLFLILFSCYGYAQGAEEPTDLDSFCDCEKDGKGTLCGRTGERTTSGHHLMLCCRGDTPQCYNPGGEKSEDGQCCAKDDQPGPVKTCDGDDVVDKKPIVYDCNPKKIKCCAGSEIDADEEGCCYTDENGNRMWGKDLTKKECCEKGIPKDSCIECEEDNGTYTQVKQCETNGCECDDKGCCKAQCEKGEVYCDENGCQTPPADDNPIGME